MVIPLPNARAGQGECTCRRASGCSRGYKTSGDAHDRLRRARHYPLLSRRVGLSECATGEGGAGFRRPATASLGGGVAEDSCVLPTIPGPERTGLSRSCLGEIARDDGGGSAVFQSCRLGSGFLQCARTSLATW